MQVSRRPLFALVAAALAAPVEAARAASIATGTPIGIPLPNEVFSIPYPLGRFVATCGSVTLNEVPFMQIDGAPAVPLFQHSEKSLLLETCVTGEWHGVVFNLDVMGKYLGHRLIPVDEPEPTWKDTSDALGRFLLGRFFGSEQRAIG